MNIKNKTILVTGASGVIGLHFLKGLQSHNAPVYAVHNRPIRESLSQLVGINFIQGDLTDMSFLKSLPTVDIIIHSATFSSPKLFTSNPISTLKLNTLTTFELLDKLNEGGKFLYISTAEVYSGLLNHVPFEESQLGTTNTKHPRACYIEGKRCGETICISSGKDVKIARIGTTYGESARTDDGRVLYDFVNQGLKYNKVTAKGGLHDIREFCYVTDAIEMMWNILLNGKEVIYNIGGGDIVEIGGLAKIVAKMTDSSVELIEDGRTPWLYCIMNMEKYNSEFGKHKNITLSEGISRVINWYKTNNEKIE